MFDFTNYSQIVKNWGTTTNILGREKSPGRWIQFVIHIHSIYFQLQKLVNLEHMHECDVNDCTIDYIEVLYS